MLPTLTSVLLVGGCISALSLRHRTLTPPIISLLLIAPVLVGLAETARRHGSLPGGPGVYLVIVAFTLGAFLVRAPDARSCIRKERQLTDHRVQGIVIFVILGLALYHFARAGVAQLSPNIEVARFAFGSSGAFGLPSRAVLFGIPALALMTLVRSDEFSVRQVRLTWAVFVVSRLLMGFKGGGQEVLIVLVTGLALKGALFRTRTLALLVPGAALAITYASWVGGQYGSVARNGGAGLSYLATRATTIAAEPGWLALYYGRAPTSGLPVYLYDARYFLEHYFGIGRGPDFAYDQLISSLLTQTPRTDQSLLVPVTVGGPAYLLTSTSVWVALVIALGLGALMMWGTRMLVRGRGLISGAAAALLIGATRNFMSNGGGVYLLINVSLTLVLLAASYGAARLLTSDTHSHRRRSKEIVLARRALRDQT